jgi:hypothetical protein
MPIRDITGDLGRRPHLVERVLASKATLRDPMAVGIIRLATKVYPCFALADIPSGGREALELVTFLLRAGESDPDSLMRQKCFTAAFCPAQANPMMWSLPDFSWEETYGIGGATAIAASEAYDYDTTHDFLNRVFSGDFFVAFAGPAMPLALHWGDMRQADDAIDRCLRSLKRIVQESDLDSENMAILCGPVCWATAIWSCRMSAERRGTLCSIMSLANLSWSKLDETVSRIADQFAPLRAIGDTTLDGQIHSGNCVLMMQKCSYVLMSEELRASEAEIMQSLPPAQTMGAEYVTRPAGPSGKLHVMFHSSHLLMNTFLSCAYVCEKFGRSEQALNYASAGLVPDLAMGGTTLGVSRVLLLSVQARALASLGRKDEAGLVFMQAADEAHRSGLYLYEAFALRDLKVCVLEASGHGDHGSRLLGAALRLLTGPAEMLTPLLDGVDAAEMMAQPEPDPSYKLPFIAESLVAEGPTETSMRQSLEGLKLSQLRRRAQAAGVGEAQMEGASDGDNERRDLVQLIIEQRKSVSAAQLSALRAELLPLKLSALRRRAIADGVSSDDMDHAADGDDERGGLITLILAQADKIVD